MAAARPSILVAPAAREVTGLGQAPVGSGVGLRPVGPNSRRRPRSRCLVREAALRKGAGRASGPGHVRGAAGESVTLRVRGTSSWS